jgi:ribokinase
MFFRTHLLLIAFAIRAVASASASASASIVVIGSINADVIVRVDRLPRPEETRLSPKNTVDVLCGGKGANQAVAAARASCAIDDVNVDDDVNRVSFVGKFGADAYGAQLFAELEAEVDLTKSARSTRGSPNGLGLVLLADDGIPSAVVVGGANVDDWPENDEVLARELREAIGNAKIVLLQREVPERVNIHAAREAKKHNAVVILDAGGSHSAVSLELLSLIDYVAPNENELQGMANAQSLATDDDVIHAARVAVGNTNVKVLVTLGARGALLVPPQGEPVRIKGMTLPSGTSEVDATAAGDTFRGAFAVALAEGRSDTEAMRFAAAAGALAVTKLGAMPSLPSRQEIDRLLGVHSTCGSPRQPRARGVVPLQFASRLNSMKARQDLFTYSDTNVPEVINLIERMASVRGVSSVFLNYPEHFVDGGKALAAADLRRAIRSFKLKMGAVCVRFPEEFRLGAFTNPNENIKQRAKTLVRDACRAANDLGADEVIIWPRYDGYDYHFQANYDEAWDSMVASYRAVATSTECNSLKISVEYKPTDEKSRFSFIPSTGSALLLVDAVGCPNFGLTLDVGHMLAAGENPAQGAAHVAARGVLFGIQLGDGHSRLGAEDGLMFGSVHRTMSMELVRQLYMSGYAGKLYFDTFPLNEDPVMEAETNIATVTHFWRLAKGALGDDLATATSSRDAVKVAQTLLKLEQGLYN